MAKLEELRVKKRSEREAREKEEAKEKEKARWADGRLILILLLSEFLVTSEFGVLLRIRSN